MNPGQVSPLTSSTTKDQRSPLGAGISRPLLIINSIPRILCGELFYNDKVAKKYIFIIIFAGLLVTAGFLFYKYNGSQVSHDISGQVKAISDKSITVAGMVRSQDKKKYDDKTIEFIITPQTIFKKTALIIPKQYQNFLGVSEQFTPATKDYPGTISDLMVGTRIILLESSDNLFTVTKATASQIQYQAFENEK